MVEQVCDKARVMSLLMRRSSEQIKELLDRAMDDELAVINKELEIKRIFSVDKSYLEELQLPPEYERLCKCIIADFNDGVLFYSSYKSEDGKLDLSLHRDLDSVSQITMLILCTDFSSIEIAKAIYAIIKNEKYIIQSFNTDTRYTSVYIQDIFE